MIYLRIRLQKLLSVLLLLGVPVLVLSCASRTYLTTYLDADLDPAHVQKVAIVLEDLKLSPADSHLFAEIFVQSAIERRRFFIVGNEREADALLKIALTHANRGDRTPGYPTSVGAYAKLLDVATRKMLWNASHAHRSVRTGYTAPVIEKVMKTVALKLVDLVPLQYTEGTLSRYDKQTYIPPGAVQTSERALQKLNSDLSRQIKSLRSGISTLKRKVSQLDSHMSSQPREGSLAESPRRETTRIQREGVPSAARKMAYSLQAGAFRSKQYAEDRKTMLAGRGHAARVVQIPDGTGETWYTVRIADYADRETATEAAAALTKKGTMEVVVVPFSGL